MSDHTVSPDEALDPDVVAIFLDESDEALADVDGHLIALESDGRDREALDAAFRAFHSLKGNSSFFGFLKVTRLAHQLEDVLDLMRDGRIAAARPVMDAVLAGVDQLKRMLAHVRAGLPEQGPEHQPVLDELLARLTAVCDAAESGAAAPVASLPVAQPSMEPAAEVASGNADPGGRTMRVEERKIDEFLDYVGELIIVREMFANVGKRLRADTSQRTLSVEYQRALEAFTALSHDLQHSIMEVRKLPVRVVLQKIPRVVRDLSASLGKDIHVTIDGGELAIDKSLLEGLEAPIMHMVRNAVDHGVEAPADRERAGKPRRGELRVTVSELPDDIVFAIEDDGRGIDGEALRAKAVKVGLLGADAAAALSLREAEELLFSPGLSTARAVTEVSGRGVGMDVVKRNVAALGGEITIHTRRGQGSRFEVRLPKTVTVQIFDGFLVRVGRERFVLPLHSIRESFRPLDDELCTIADRGECVSRRGRLLPLWRFADMLAIEAARRPASDGIVVSVDIGDGMVAGLMVDDVLGTQQVVLREVAGLDATRSPFSGGAVLGDGRVAMVVDVQRLGGLVA